MNLLEQAMTPAAILAMLRLKTDDAERHRDRAQRYRDEDAQAYWAGRVDSYKEVTKNLSVYWASTGALV